MWKVSFNGMWFNLHDVRSEGLPTDQIMANRDILDLSTVSTKSTFSSVYIRTVFIVIVRGRESFTNLQILEIYITTKSQIEKHMTCWKGPTSFDVLHNVLKVNDSEM